MPDYIADFVQLKTLKLSKNKLMTLPERMKTIPMLASLDLSNNKLGLKNSSRWKWLEGQQIQNTLTYFNLDNNNIVSKY